MTVDRPDVLTLDEKRAFAQARAAAASDLPLTPELAGELVEIISRLATEASR